MQLFGRKKQKANDKHGPGFIRRASGGVYRNFFNVTGWVSAGFLGEHTRGLWGCMKYFLHYRGPTQSPLETFEQAMFRLGLTEEDVQVRAQQVNLQAWVYNILACLIFIYATYLWIAATLLTAVIAYIICAACLIKALSMRFWLYQIRRRRLGCSLREYFGLSRKENT